VHISSIFETIQEILKDKIRFYLLLRMLELQKGCECIVPTHLLLMVIIDFISY
jgi:hypothetical protein